MLHGEAGRRSRFRGPRATNASLIDCDALALLRRSDHRRHWYVQEYRGHRLVWQSGWDEEAGFSALYLKVPERDLTLILLANGEGLWWENRLDRADVERSPFARAFLDRFVFGRTARLRDGIVLEQAARQGALPGRSRTAHAVAAQARPPDCTVRFATGAL